MVAELRGPDGQVHPVGEYLADQLTGALQKEFPDLEVIDRARQKTNTSDNRDSKDKSAALDKKAKAWARNLGAKFVITGSFAKVSQGIGVSLSAMLSNDSSSRLGVTNGLVPITDEIMALSSDPIPSPKNGIPEAGVGGTTVPTCARCPAPDYTSRARAAKFQGVVILDVVVNPDGQTGQITVVEGPGLGMEESAIKTLKSWKFKPAIGPDGTPVQVHVPIELTFRMFD